MRQVHRHNGPGRAPATGSQPHREAHRRPPAPGPHPARLPRGPVSPRPRPARSRRRAPARALCNGNTGGRARLKAGEYTLGRTGGTYLARLGSVGHGCSGIAVTLGPTARWFVISPCHIPVRVPGVPHPPAHTHFFFFFLLASAPAVPERCERLRQRVARGESWHPRDHDPRHPRCRRKPPLKVS